MKTAERVGDWIQTTSGLCIYPLDPLPEEICIEDIAHSLSLQCRYNGHTRCFYSVAEHSVRVSWIVPPKDALWGLMHDAAEAYLGDLVRPIKRFSEMGRLFMEFEERLMACIALKFGLSWPEPESVKKADTILLMTEKRDLMTIEPKPWEDTEAPLDHVIDPWPSKYAEEAFLCRFVTLEILKNQSTAEVSA